MRLDLGQFKKVSEDNHSAILAHPRGHHIVIAKNSLNPKLKEQLSKLPSLSSPKMMVDGGDPVDAPDANDLDISPASDQEVQDVSGGDTPTPASPGDAGSAAPGVSGTDSGPQKYAMPAPAAADQSASSPQINAIQGIQSGFQQQIAGTKELYQAQADAAKKQAVAAQEFANEQKLHNDLAVKEYMGMKEQLSKAMVDVQNGHINPNHYIQNMSTFGKVSTAIGLFLGGLSTAFRGGPNPALQFVNDQINRDVQGQIADLGKKENIMSAYMRQTGNFFTAQAMTRGFYTELYKTEVQKIASQSQSEQALAQAKVLTGVLEKEQGLALAPAASLQSSQRMAASGQTSPGLMARAIPDEKSKDLAYKEAAKIGEIEQLRKNFQSSFDDLNARALGGLLSPADRQSAIQAFAGPVAKMAEGRFNFDESMQQVEALLPSWKDGKEARGLKQQRLNAFFDSFSQTPVLDSYYPNWKHNYVKRALQPNPSMTAMQPGK